MEKIKDNTTLLKFKSFVKYFKDDKEAKKPRAPRASLKTNQKEMIEEISKFVESKDFNKFYRKCKHQISNFTL